MAIKSSFKNMVLCLGVTTLVCGALLGGAYALTQEPIAQAAQKQTRDALAAVLPSFASLSDKLQDGDTSYYIAYGNAGDTVGVAINASASGFGGALELMVGFYRDGRICNTAVLSQNETPGLGAKCVEEEFASQFRDFDPSVKKLVACKKGQTGGDINAITAATITSRAYCAAVEAARSAFNNIIPAEVVVPEEETVIIKEEEEQGNE